MDPTKNARSRMVAEQLEARGIRDPRVLDAMRTVPRHLFVAESALAEAHADNPLPIGHGQTISQPYVVALMAEALRIAPTARVLEIGTGSGYAAAVLGALACEVITIERHAQLALRAQTALEKLGVANVHVFVGDGSLGWPKRAPYDAISVTASGPHVPLALMQQLAECGRLVIPVGPDLSRQNLVLVTRQAHDAFVQTTICPVRFVPLVGEQAWPSGKGLSE